MARLARLLMGTVVAWGLVLAPVAMAREGDDADALIVQFTKLYDEGKYTEAMPLAQRVLAIREKALGPDSPDVATAINNLALLYDGQGRYAEAEPLYQRALAIDEKALGPDSPDVATALNNLAELYGDQGRYAVAEPLMKRALAIREKALGSVHPDVGESLNNLAELCRLQRRYSEAEPLYKRSLSIREKALGPNSPDVAQSFNNLALLYMMQGRYGEAEPFYKRVLSIREKALGPDHPDVGRSLDNLAELYRDQGRYAEAEPLYKRSLGAYETALGPDHPDVGKSLNNLAYLRFVQSDWAGAAAFWRRSTGIIIRRAERGLNFEQNSRQFLWLAKVARRVAAAEHAPDPGLAAEIFQTAQWARSSDAAASLAQMAARGATGDPKLAAIARERQDLVAEWQKRDASRGVAVSQPPDKHNKEAEATNVARLAEIDTRISEIDKQLTKEFPDYAALVSPKPLSITDVQSELRDGEALVLFLDTPELDTPKLKPTPEETFIWVVTRTDSRWVRSELGTEALGERVAALRCGLDSSNWTDASRWSDATEEARRHKEAQIARRERCKTLTGADVTDREAPPFDVAKANELYQALFGQVEALLKNPDGTAKQLLVVLSGPLAQVPFQALVAEKPDPGLSGLDALKYAAWLIRSHTLTVLPSVSSLRALRQLAKDSHASRALIGFGDPLLDGQPDKYPDDGPLAVRARANQSCPKTVSPQVADLRGELRGMLPLKLRGGTADVVQIRSQVPLPETAHELCAVAGDLGTGGDDIWLGARATETEIKRLSQSGELSKYRVIHFATHCALAGQVGGDSEPGLLLTPPDKASATDDGYLSASEIAGLKLDADWVILSGCNTAAGGEEGAEALSSLAQAFFYAGAHALLVSHWSVYSDATVKLITGAMSRIAADRSVGRAEAMRQSMLALIDKGAPYEAHPAFWAQFIVVGEGAVR